MIIQKQISILLFVLAFAIYGNTLTHDFALDDHIVITGNNFTKKRSRRHKEYHDS